jgi:hypothetical protein
VATFFLHMKTLLLMLSLLAVRHVGADPILVAKKSLPYLKEKGLAWIEDRQCASCHQVPSMLWSLNLAASVGLDDTRLETQKWTPWAADWRHWNQTSEKEGVDKVSAGNIDTMVFLLLGRDVNVPSPAWVQAFHAQILKHQQPDGSWKAGGQLPLGKRPVREIHEVTTMWTLLALKSDLGQPVPAETLQRAAAYLAAAQPGVSTEWHACRLLLNPADHALRDALLQAQHEDGGWGWLMNDPSDAFGTGLALHALTSAGGTQEMPPMQKALAFLEKTQMADGSWAVPSTRARDNNKINKTASYWGTAWAAIALLDLTRKNAAATPE